MTDEQQWYFLVEYDERLAHIATRIRAIRKKNKEMTGNARPMGNFAERVWVGGDGKEGVWDQICDVVGMDSNNPIEVLRSDDVYTFVHNYLKNMLYEKDPDWPW